MVKSIGAKYGHPDIFNISNVDEYQSIVNSILLNLLDSERQSENDTARVNVSTRYNYYKDVANENVFPCNYLQTREMKALVSQFRLNVNCTYHNKYYHEFYKGDQCILCNQENSLSHFLLECVPISSLAKMRTIYKGVNDFVSISSNKDISTFYYNKLLCIRIGPSGFSAAF